MRLAMKALATFLVVFASASFAQQPVSATCSETSKMTVYSNAYFSDEGGDVIGYELAVPVNGGSNGRSLLFIYEGEANEVGIELTGRIERSKLSLTGKWVEHPVEYPSHAKLTQNHSADLQAIVKLKAIHGELIIDGASQPIRMKQVRHLWLCGSVAH